MSKIFPVWYPIKDAAPYKEVNLRFFHVPSPETVKWLLIGPLFLLISWCTAKLANWPNTSFTVVKMVFNQDHVVKYLFQKRWIKNTNVATARRAPRVSHFWECLLLDAATKKERFFDRPHWEIKVGEQKNLRSTTISVCRSYTSWVSIIQEAVWIFKYKLFWFPSRFWKPEPHKEFCALTSSQTIKGAFRLWLRSSRILEFREMFGGQ